MFAENEQISTRQLGEQMVLTFLGPAVWQLSASGAAGGFPGLLGIVAGYLFLLLWCVLLFRQEGIYRRLSYYAGKPGEILLKGMCLALLFWAGGYLLQKTAVFSTTYLTAGISEKWAAFFLLFAASFGVQQRTEQRGRLAELLLCWIFWGFLLLLFFTLPQIRREALGEMVPVWGKLAGNVDNVWKIAWESGKKTVEMGTPLILLPFLLKNVRRNEKKQPPFWTAAKSLGILAGITVLTSLVLAGVFGCRQLAKIQDPLLLMMGETSIPGGFLERFDMVWMLFLLTALLFTLGSLFFYAGLLWPQVFGTYPGRAGFGVLLWVSAFLWKPGGGTGSAFWIFPLISLVLQFAVRTPGKESGA